jgi:flavin-dependent dehydrogenase
MKKISSVAVIGGGPAGAALATHLRRKQITVALFDPGKRPDLLVGESLVPALIPLLRELGIEEEVAAISTYKPGATFYTTPEQENSFFFNRAGKGSPTYAYNSPRAEFDALVLTNAIRLGAIHIPQIATFAPPSKDREVAFDQKTLDIWKQATGLDQPDLIVDASGRNRVLTKLLNLPSSAGGRKDVALFAHVPAAETPHEGHIHINRLKRGWSWRIPLPNRVSVGVVIPREALKNYGASAEEQYDRLLHEEPVMQSYVTSTERLTPVMKYTNYQLSSDRWTGKQWALVGDAGGFIDPIFSSGLLLALEGASELTRAILAGWDTHAARYEKRMRAKLKAWRSLIDAYYDGRIFTLFRLQRLYHGSRLMRLLTRRVEQQLSLALSGVAPTSKRRLWLLNFLLRYLEKLRMPARVRIS